MKKWRVLLLALFLIMLSAGCGKTDSEPESFMQDGTAPLKSQEDELPQNDGEEMVDTIGEPVTTISVMRPCYKLSETDDAQTGKVEDAINAYLADKMNVQIRLEDVPAGEYMGRAVQAIQQKEVDLLWTSSWLGSAGTDRLVANGAAYDITELLRGTQLYDAVGESLWESAKYDGRNYFVPLVSSDNTESYAFVTRKELAEEYGLDVNGILTWQDIEPFLEDCAKGGVEYPFLMRGAGVFRWLYLDDFDFFTADSASDFIAVERDKNEVVETVLTPQFKEYAMQIAEWKKKGYVFHDDTKDVNLMEFAKHWGTRLSVYAADSEKTLENMYQQEMVAVPVTGNWYHTGSGLKFCYCIMAGCSEEKAKACLDFLGLLHTDRTLADLYTYGLEGEDYSYNEEGQVVQEGEGYGHFAWEAVSADAVSPAEGDPADLGTLCREYNSGGKLSCAAGFHFDITPVEEQFAACQGACYEYGYPLECGEYGPSEVDERIAQYHEALHDAGLQTVLSEFQKQYDEWKGISGAGVKNLFFTTVCSADEALKIAKENSVVVRENVMCTYGKDVWESFYQKVQNKEPASVLSVIYDTLENENVSEEYYESEKDNYPKLFFILLEYDGECFRISDRICTEEQPEIEREFAYLKHFTGSMPEQAKYSTYDYYILVDDENVTWDDIEASLLGIKDYIRFDFAYMDHF